MPEENDLESLFAAAEAEIDGGGDEIQEIQVDDDLDDQSTDDVEGDETDIETDEGEDDGDGEEDGNPDDDGTDEGSWNWEDYADQLVPRTVNGVTEMVSLKEAIAGSMRQQDYTVKTQQLAERERAARWAEDVQRAFSVDPRGTLEAFARAYGLAGQQQEDDSPSLDDLDEDVRPWAERAMQAQDQLSAMEQRLMQLENERIKSEVRAELDSLKARFGDEFDAVKVLEVAAQRQMGLEDAFWLWYGQNQQSLRQQQQQVDSTASDAAAKAAERAKSDRAKRKRRAASTSRGSFKASDIPADDFDDIGELFEQIAAGSSS